MLWSGTGSGNYNKISTISPSKSSMFSCQADRIWLVGTSARTIWLPRQERLKEEEERGKFERQIKVWCCAHAASSKPGKPRPDTKYIYIYIYKYYKKKIYHHHGRRAKLASHQAIRNKYNLQPAGRSFTWRGRAWPSILGQSFAGASKICPKFQWQHLDCAVGA